MERMGFRAVPEEVLLTQMDYEVYPEALEHVIRKVNSELPGMPIMITENGIATSDDVQRIEFIKAVMDGVKNCINDGIPVIGYCHWSLMDNFEWQKGYQMTFGMCAVDRTTQERHPKEIVWRSLEVIIKNRKERDETRSSVCEEK